MFLALLYSKKQLKSDKIGVEMKVFFRKHLHNKIIVISLTKIIEKLFTTPLKTKIMKVNNPYEEANNKFSDNDLLIKSMNWKFKQQNVKDRNLWNNLIIVHNYFYKCNMELKRSFLMELFYPNQKIWDATTIDVYRRYIERAGYSSKIKTGVYKPRFYLPNISLEYIKKEGIKISNQKPF